MNERKKKKQVFYGVWNGEPVALKKLKSDAQLNEFIKEAKTLR